MKKGTDPEIMLFDQIILAKRNRGRTSIFSKSSTTHPHSHYTRLDF